MSPLSMVELALAVALAAVGVWLYRRPKAPGDSADSYGSQGAVILFVVAVIMAIHALGALKYHPSAAEAEFLREHSR